MPLLNDSDGHHPNIERLTGRAWAIEMARYIRFSEKTGTFAENFATSFHPLNLSALSATLIESELFGHCRGSFTGAVSDRAGWLESCGKYGTVFLDEIGELDGLIQVKLLCVLQMRTLSRLGETALRRSRGKIIAATNRDLAKEMATGALREDLYYRLCSDLIMSHHCASSLWRATGRRSPGGRCIGG